MGHRQKGKAMKRKRSWHHLRNQDGKWARAMKRLRFDEPVTEALATPAVDLSAGEEGRHG